MELGWALKSIPELAFPGGCLVGCTAGFLNVPKLKGVHYAMKTGMLGAEAAVDAIRQEGASDSKGPLPFPLPSSLPSPAVIITPPVHPGLHPASFPDKVKASFVWADLKKARNVRPSFNTNLGLYGGFLYTGLFYIGLQGKEPWTLSHGGMTSMDSNATKSPNHKLLRCGPHEAGEGERVRSARVPEAGREADL